MRVVKEREIITHEHNSECYLNEGGDTCESCPVAKECVDAMPFNPNTKEKTKWKLKSN